MITAVDTNVLLDLLVGDARFVALSRDALLRSRAAGRLCVCEMVYTELAAAFGGELDRLRSFLVDAEIELDRSTETTLGDSGRRWQSYRRSGGARRRVLADFLIGAHAACQADVLLTRDRGFYRLWFDDLAVLDPSSGGS